MNNRIWKSKILFIISCVLGVTSGCIDIGRECEPPVEKVAPFIPAHQKFLPNHLALLEKTGWLRFVDFNVDAVEYENRSFFDSSTGPAPGTVREENGRRIASVALKGHSDEEAVAALVHLAAHLSGVAQVGKLYDHDSALAVEARFRHELALKSH